MGKDDDARAAAMERLSALVDGELDATGVALACADWRDQDELRAMWHASHLIGDVLRSEDLAGDPARELQFIDRFRTRLAAEPVVLAPDREAEVAAESSPVGRAVGDGRRRTWLLPSAIAAGFVAVAGVLLVMRAPGVADAQPGAGVLALVDPGVPSDVVAATAATAPSSTGQPPTLVVTGRLIRDAQLDRYLSAHKQFAGTSALGVPSAFLRNATSTVPDR